MTASKLRYPIGKFIKPDTITSEFINEYIRTIGAFPSRLSEEVAHLNDEQLDTPYRPEGWTIRQVVNHCADSKAIPIEPALIMLKGMHERWSLALRSSPGAYHDTKKIAKLAIND